jgi:hypothetical protein
MFVLFCFVLVWFALLVCSFENFVLTIRGRGNLSPRQPTSPGRNLSQSANNNNSPHTNASPLSQGAQSQPQSPRPLSPRLCVEELMAVTSSQPSQPLSPRSANDGNPVKKKSKGFLGFGKK